MQLSFGPSDSKYHRYAMENSSPESALPLAHAAVVFPIPGPSLMLHPYFLADAPAEDEL